jgi:hypothetical protein
LEIGELKIENFQFSILQFPIKKGHRYTRCPFNEGVAGDPAPQQLTAPCRKYTGRQRGTGEQATYRRFSKEIE